MEWLIFQLILAIVIPTTNGIIYDEDLFEKDLMKIDGNTMDDSPKSMRDLVRKAMEAKIAENERELSKLLLEKLEKGIMKTKVTTPRDVIPHCEDELDECELLKMQNVCKTSKNVMMQRCRKTCGLCEMNITHESGSLTEKPHIKALPRKKKIKAKSPKKKNKTSNSLKKLKKSSKKQKRKKVEKNAIKSHVIIKCSGVCKNKCSPKCPKKCCTTQKSFKNTSKPRKGPCPNDCPKICQPSCSFECCTNKSTNIKKPANVQKFGENSSMKNLSESKSKGVDNEEIVKSLRKYFENIVNTHIGDTLPLALSKFNSQIPNTGYITTDDQIQNPDSHLDEPMMEQNKLAIEANQEISNNNNNNPAGEANLNIPDICDPNCYVFCFDFCSPECCSKPNEESALTPSDENSRIISDITGNNLMNETVSDLDAKCPAECKITCASNICPSYCCSSINLVSQQSDDSSYQNAVPDFSDFFQFNQPMGLDETCPEECQTHCSPKCAFRKCCTRK